MKANFVSLALTIARLKKPVIPTLPDQISATHHVFPPLGPAGHVGCPPKPTAMNFNVHLSLWWTCVENVSASIRAGDATSAYLYLLTKKNSVVGYVQGINGIMQLVAAMPAGYMADITRRDSVLKVGAVVGLCGGSTLAWAVASAHSAVAVAIAMAVLGTYRGLYNSSLEALFADSVETGRSSPYTWRYVIMTLSSGAGPLLSLAAFYYLGNEWTVSNCRLVILIGIACMVPALIMMCFFDDDKALGHHSEALVVPLLEEGNENDDENGSDDVGEGEGERETEIPNNLPLISRQDGPKTSRGGCRSVSSTLAVPVLLTFSDFLAALASGMTIKFFSLFFMQKVGFGPMAVSVLSALAPLGVSGASIVAQRVSKQIGRVQLSMVTRVIDIALLVAMAKMPTTPGLATQLLVAVHLLRAAVANCTRPLLRSVLNQFVPKKHRGKMSAVDSVRTFSWSGSAALGGILVEKIGFEGTFIVTAIIKAAAVAPLPFLLPHVPDGIFAGGVVLKQNMAPRGAVGSFLQDGNDGGGGGHASQRPSGDASRPLLPPPSSPLANSANTRS